MADQLLISAHEAAELLSLPTARLKRLAKRQEVPHVMLPDGEIRFRPTDLEDWVGRHTIPKKEHAESQLDLFTDHEAANGRGNDPTAAAESGPPPRSASRRRTRG